MEVDELRTQAMVYTGGNIRLSGIDWVALILVIVGAVNWGLVGLGMLLTGAAALESWNLVNILLGWSPLLEAIVYLLVGLAGLYELYFAYELGSTSQSETTARAD